MITVYKHFMYKTSTKFHVAKNDMHVIAAVWYFFAKRDSISLHEW